MGRVSATHVIALNPPWTLDDHLEVENVGGLETWTIFGTSAADFRMAAKLTEFLRLVHLAKKGKDPSTQKYLLVSPDKFSLIAVVIRKSNKCTRVDHF